MLSHHHIDRRQTRRGFSLVAVLVLLPLLMILVVSFAALLRNEMVVSSASRNQVIAKQNALAALQIAVGQLQQYTGKDQAVTFPATTYYPRKDTTTATGELYDDGTFGYRTHGATSTSISYLKNVGTWLTPTEREAWDQSLDNWWNNGGNARNPHWTGVMDSSLRKDIGTQAYEANPNTKFGEFQRNQLPVWLVSGNERYSIDAASGQVFDHDGNLVSTGTYPSGSFPDGYRTPDEILPDPDNDDRVIYLVGMGSATDETDSTDGLDGRVVAQKIGVENPAGVTTGHYAYWVGDESTKANFAIRDPYHDATPGTADYFNRLQVPQRVGWENLEGFDGVSGIDPNDPLLELITIPSEIGLLHKSLKSPDDQVARNFHQLTAYSKSLHTNTARGGLKKDLTRYLEDGAGLVDAATIPDSNNYVDTDPRWGNANRGFPGSPTNIPTWGQIKSWHDNAAPSGGTASVSVTPDTAPVVTYFRMHTAFTHDNGKLQIHFLPVVTLWNPYDADLETTRYRLRVRTNFSLWGFGIATQGKTDPTPPTSTTDEANYDDGFETSDGYFVNLLNILPTAWKAEYTNLNNLCVVQSGLPLPAYRFAPWNGADADYKNNPNNSIGTWLEFDLGSISIPAGEAMVFTVGEGGNNTAPLDHQKIADPTDMPILLHNKYDPDYPASFYFDIADIVEPPGGSTVPTAADTVRFYGEANSTTSQSHAMELWTGATQLWKHYNFGQNYAPGISIKYGDRRNTPYALRDQPSTWRRVYDLDTWQRMSKSGETQTQNAPIYSLSEAFIKPFNPVDRLVSENDGLNKFYRGFSLFNINAKSLDFHRELEGGRNRNASNNSDHFEMMQFTVGSDSDGGVKDGLDWDPPSPADAIHFDNGAGPRGWILTEHVAINRDRQRNILGMEKMSLRQVRRTSFNVLSIGQLQQVNLSPFVWQPAFPIGNAEASAYVDRERMAGISRNIGSANGTHGFIFDRVGSQPFPNNANNDFIDLSYTLNESLWDDYFLSSIPGSGSVSMDNTQPLDNSRHRFRTDFTPTETEVRNFNDAAGYLYNFGALNVNSTSVEAWKALITAYRDLEVAGEGGDYDSDGTPDVPVTRTLSPQEGSIEFTFDTQQPADIGAVASGRDYKKILTGFRFLTDAMVEQLANRIVDEIRLRGPFLSLGDFVNRRLVSPDKSGGHWLQARSRSGDTVGNLENPGPINNSYDSFLGLQGLNGALQRAINVSGINGGMNYLDSNLNRQPQNLQDWVYSVNLNQLELDSQGNYSISLPHPSHPMMILPELRHYLDTEHLAGVPVGERGQLLQGAPGFVTQGDLLAMFGSALTPRGDTFLVRAYGDSVSPSGTILARAWLEAVVQRVADPVNPAAETGSDQWRYTTSQGRRYKIVQLRWLSPEDV